MKSSLNDEWTTKELLYLGSAVCEYGEDNWPIISKTLLSHHIERNRPSNWYGVNSCASQYQNLCTKYPLPKKSFGTQATHIQNELKKDRIDELQCRLQEKRSMHDKLLKEMTMLDSGDLDSQLDHMWQEIIDSQAQEEAEKDDNKVSVQKYLLENTGTEKSQVSQSTEPSVTTIHPKTETDTPVASTISGSQSSTKNPKEITGTQPVVENVIEIKIEPVEPEAPDTSTPVCSDTADRVDEVKKELQDDLSINTPDKPIQSTKDVMVKSPVKATPTLDAAEIARREAINQLYDNITDDHDAFPSKMSEMPSLQRSTKKPIEKPTEGPLSSETLPIKVDTKAKSKKRSFDTMNESCETEDDEETSEPTRKMTRSEMKKEEIKTEPEEKRPFKEETDDEESRDSTEVKEILMFPRSERRRVYGHDDAASPVISESTPSSPASTYCGDDSEGEKAYKSWKKAIMLIWNDISAHKYASVFHRPVTDDKVRGYHSIVYKPTDLQTIKRQVETGSIRNTVEFERELMLMFLNARMYNTDGHEIAHMASQMMMDTVATIQEFNNVQSVSKSVEQSHKSLRRETREHSKKSEDAKKSSKRRKN